MSLFDRTIKREIPLFSYYDFSGMARHLEEMARRGWQLENIGGRFWRYRRCPPTEMRYAVVYFEKASDLDTAPLQEQQDFWEMCRTAGWELAASRGVMQIFRNPDPHAIPIETDPVVQVENIRASMKKTHNLSFAVLLFCVLAQLLLAVRRYANDLKSLLVSPLDLLNLMIYAVLGLYCASELFSYFRWLRKARAAAREEGTLLPSKSSRWRQATLLAFCFLWIPLLLVYAFGLLGFSRGNLWGILFGLAYVAVLLGAVRGSQYLMKRGGVSPVTNRILSGVIGAAACFALLFGMVKIVTSGIFSLSLQGHTNAEPVSYTLGGQTYTYDFYRDALPLAVEDLTGGAPDPDYSRRLDINGSPLLRQYDARQVIPYYLDADAPELYYTVWEVGADFLYAPVKKTFFRDEVYNIRGQVDFVIPHGWEPTDAAPWGALEAYQRHDEDGNPTDAYLLCYEDRFVVIRFDGWDAAPPTAVQAALVGRVLGTGALS